MLAMMEHEKYQQNQLDICDGYVKTCHGMTIRMMTSKPMNDIVILHVLQTITCFRVRCDSMTKRARCLTLQLGNPPIFS